MRFATKLQIALCLLALAGCGDVVGNTAGLNGVPSQNKPIGLDGDWAGIFQPAQTWRHVMHQFPDPLPEPCVTRGADVTLSVSGPEVLGNVRTVEGQVFGVRAKAWAGAAHTGLNSITAELILNGTKAGDLSLVPGRGFQELTGTYRFRLSPDAYYCAAEALLRRAPKSAS